MLDAVRQLRGEREIVFLFMGGGHLMQRLKLDVERQGLVGMFRFLPYQEAHVLLQSLAVTDIHLISLLPSMGGLIMPCKFYSVAAPGRPTIAISDPKGEIA